MVVLVTSLVMAMMGVPFFRIGNLAAAEISLKAVRCGPPEILPTWGKWSPNYCVELSAGCLEGSRRFESRVLKVSVGHLAGKSWNPVE